MAKTSKHTQAILALVAAQSNITTSDVAEALKLSASRARELLALETKAGRLRSEHMNDDGVKYLIYHLPTDGSATDEAAKEEPAAPAANTKAPKKSAGKQPPKAKKAKTPKTQKPRRKASGIGKPNAKKVVNPQQTLDLKKAMVERNGGKMVWANRLWSISVKGGESAVLKSRELAGMTLEALAKTLGITA